MFFLCKEKVQNGRSVKMEDFDHTWEADWDKLTWKRISLCITWIWLSVLTNLVLIITWFTTDNTLLLLGASALAFIFCYIMFYRKKKSSFFPHSTFFFISDVCLHLNTVMLKTQLKIPILDASTKLNQNFHQKSEKYI